MIDELLIRSARMVNDGRILEGDLLVRNGRIERIAPEITAGFTTRVLEADGRLLMPGMIDDQVHFREPGVTHISTTSRGRRSRVASPAIWRCPTRCRRR